MAQHIFVAFLLISAVLLIDAAPDTRDCSEICAATSCIAVGVCNGPNQELRRGKLHGPQPCNCCSVCVTILGEGDKCENLPLVNGFPPAVECCKRQKLVCKDGTCQKA